MTDSTPSQPDGIVEKWRRLAARGIRLARRVTARITTTAANVIRPKAKKPKIRLDDLREGLDIRPISDLAFPSINLATSENPITEIMTAPEFVATGAFFYDNPVAARSLISSQSQALLYSIIRNLCPEHVFEIGAYKAGTTEAICRALHSNNRGIAHAVDPFQGEDIAEVLKFWPPELLRHVRLHIKDSMAFFGDMERQRIHPELVFVDGNHEYEYAAFDIACGARLLAPGGFIFVDNVSQPGPFFAAHDFLAANPGWRELGDAASHYNREKAFDTGRGTIVGTDFIVLRAPVTYGVGERPFNIERIRWGTGKVAGLHLKLVPPDQGGRLTVQAVLRGFGAVLVETTSEASVQVEAGRTDLSVALTPPAHVDGQFVYYTVEPWLIWHGAQPLQLRAPPEPF